MSNRATNLDTLYQVETPEGINLTFHPASAIIRGLALAIDLCCQGGILLLAIIFLSLLVNLLGFDFDSLFTGIITILFFIINWWYFVLFEVLKNGQTIGKKMFNLQVIHDDGTPITWSASLLRNLLRVVDILPALTYAVGILVSFNNHHFKRLGDIAAGTLVIYYRPNLQIKESSFPSVPSSPAPFPLSIEERAIIISYAMRSESFSAQRRLELANILNNTFKTTTSESEQKLYAIARHLVGYDDAIEPEENEEPKEDEANRDNEHDL